MNYIENIYICLAAPLLIVVLCLRGQGKRSILFVLGGMTACLLSSYISTFLAVVHGTDAMNCIHRDQSDGRGVHETVPDRLLYPGV